MAVFYAYITNVDADNTWRVSLVFQDSATADQWWRAISDSKSTNTFLQDIQRLAPQVYVHKASIFNILNFFTDSRITSISSPFRGKLILTLENDRGGRGLSIIPPQDVTDLVSGNWFYVRSKVAHNTFWYYDSKNNIVRTSTTKRTLFQVNAQDLPSGTIIIGTDSVTLTASPNVSIGIDSQGNLVGGSTPWDFSFSGLANGRFVGDDHGITFENVDDTSPKKEGWELVN